MSLTGSEERPVWLPRHTVLPDGTVHRSPSPSRAGPEIVFVRYGSALDLLVAGGSVAAASATLLTLAVKADEIATRLFAIPEKIRTRRKQLRAEGARAEREEAEAVLDKARFEQETRRYRGGALTPAETQAFERLTVDLAAQDRTSEGRTTVLEQNFAQPDLVGPPPEFGDAEAAQVVQLRDRISEIAGPVDAQLTAPPTETG